MAISCISASSWSAYACSKASLGGRALLCHLAIADVILRLGPNNLGKEKGFSILTLEHSKLWRRGFSIPVRDPNFLEVVFSEGEEYSQVDVLLLQQREILGEADLFQELCQILPEWEHRGHPRSKI